MKKQIEKLAKKAKKEKNKANKFKKLAIEFLGVTCLVFNSDWEHTKYCLQLREDGTNDYWDKGGTFLEPNIEDSPENWGCRLGFLHAFRKFRALVKKDKFFKNSFPENAFEGLYHI